MRAGPRIAPLSGFAAACAVAAALTAGALLAAPPTPRPATRPPGDAAAPPITSSEAGPCGKDGGPDCPLQAWMKANAGPTAKTGDIDGMAAAFDAIAGFAPHASAFPNWASIAKDGAGVARRGRVDAARVACVSCHEQYRSRFQKELRELPLDAIVDAGALDGGGKP